ncbi:MAG: hypothetical protein KC422_18590 [Trueperaceae bacterium]|nr:hypothetical protein [Trueperaceae bacterium]
MPNPKELELIDQLLDSSRKLAKYVDDLPTEHKELALAIKRKFNQLLNQALDIYFNSDDKAEELATVLIEVHQLLEQQAEPQVIYNRLVA